MWKTGPVREKVCRRCFLLTEAGLQLKHFVYKLAIGSNHCLLQGKQLWQGLEDSWARHKKMRNLNICDNSKQISRPLAISLFSYSKKSIIQLPSNSMYQLSNCDLRAVGVTWTVHKTPLNIQWWLGLWIKSWDVCPMCSVSIIMFRTCIVPWVLCGLQQFWESKVVKLIHRLIIQLHPTMRRWRHI